MRLRSSWSALQKALPGSVSLRSPPSSSAKQLQRLGHWEQFVDLHLQLGGDLREVGGPVVGRGRHGLEQA
jgi:hypothetical protein